MLYGILVVCMCSVGTLYADVSSAERHSETHCAPVSFVLEDAKALIHIIMNLAGYTQSNFFLATVANNKVALLRVAGNGCS